jgi:hypothetical protein
MARKKKEHNLSLDYTTSDDGVHVFCSCGEDINLGFDCSPREAYVKSQAHIKGREAELISESWMW